MSTNLSGRTLDQYHLIERIGGGGMGDVYRAVDRQRARTVAVKVLKEHLGESEEFVHRFVQEGRLAMLLGQHPHLVTVYDVGRADGWWYLAMAFLDGQPLSRILREYPLLPMPYVVQFIGQIAAALDFMHGQRPAPVVHRDVKPGNIMIDNLGHRATLMDFGLARSLAASRISMADQLVGTAPYMAPEQTSGQAGPQADVWSLGVVAFEMLCGQAPFGDDDAVAILYRAKHETPPEACGLNPLLPAAVETVFATVFEKDPARRLARAGAFSNALRLALGDVGRMSDDDHFGFPLPAPNALHGSSIPSTRSSSTPSGRSTPVTPRPDSRHLTPATPTSRPGSEARTPPHTGPSSAQLVGMMFIVLGLLLGIALVLKITVDDPLRSAQATAAAVATTAREANAVLATAAVDAQDVNLFAARATADSAGERVAAAQATLQIVREQATKTARAADKSADRTPPAVAETGSAAGEATRLALSPGGDPLLTLISPGLGESVSGCVFFAWSAPPPDLETGSRYDLLLCSERLAGTACEPTHGIRTTQRTSDAWQPDKPDELTAGIGIWDSGPQTLRWQVQLSDRPDVASGIGVFQWRPGTAPCRSN